MIRMKVRFLSQRVRTACAVGLATLMLATLAHADPGNGKGIGQGDGGGNGHNDPVPTVPEANAGVVLIPVVAAVLFFSTRRLWLAKATLDTEGQNGSR
jgi:hypothetical protein